MNQYRFVTAIFPPVLIFKIFPDDVRLILPTTPPRGTNADNTDPDTAPPNTLKILIGVVGLSVTVNTEVVTPEKSKIGTVVLNPIAGINPLKLVMGVGATLLVAGKTASERAFENWRVPIFAVN